MRWLAMVVVLSLAGCAGGPGSAGDGDEADPADTGDDGGTAQATLPASQRHEIHIGQGFDSVGEPVAGRCELQPWCFGYPFAIPVGQEATLQATLEWALPASDFDLYLANGDGAVLEQATTRGPHVTETLDVRIGAGEYRVLVVPYAVPSDDAVLQMTFEA